MRVAALFEPKAGSGINNGYHFVLPVGHAVAGSLRGLYLTDQFLADPTVRPNGACIEEMTVEWSTR